MKKRLTIDDLLDSLKNPVKKTIADLPNTKSTWARIGRRDSFEELGLEGSELDSFLKEWTSNNDYNNLI
jgi:hypothetical protein